MGAIACSGPESYPDSYSMFYPDSYSMKDLADEPPITQADIDALERMKAKYGTIDINNQKKLAALAKANGLTHKRFHYLIAKLTMAINLALGNNVIYPNDCPVNQRVTAEELAIVKRNLNKGTKPGSPRAF